MIASLTGSFVIKTPSYIHIDVHGVGYEVQISLNTYSKIQDLKEGTVLTHLQIKEDGHTLFGFAELAEKERLRSESIQRELITLLSDVEGAVSGDLTVRAQISAGEIGIVADFFNAIVESLRDVVTQVKLATLQVNNSVRNEK